MVEHSAVNRTVVGSNPTCGAIFYKSEKWINIIPVGVIFFEFRDQVHAHVLMYYRSRGITTLIESLFDYILLKKEDD